MGRMSWATYLWPGLPQLWYGGFTAGLVLAVGFALLLNVLLVASFVWIEVLSSWHLRLGWLAIAGLWVISATATSRFTRTDQPADERESAEDLFRQALSEYLQRSWFEAERILGRLLLLSPRDVEAGLLLATLLRRSGRRDEASAELGRIELLGDADRWCFEIAAERQLLAESRGAADEPATADDASSRPQPQRAA